MSHPSDSEARKKRDKALQTQDEAIGQLIARAYESGEIQSAESFGKPMKADGFMETPGEFRMSFKILRNAGAAPPELGLFHKRAELREALARAVDEAERHCLQQQLIELEQLLALRLEGMRVSGRL